MRFYKKRKTAENQRFIKLSVELEGVEPFVLYCYISEN